MAGEAFTREQVRAVLTGESTGLASQRRVFRRIPSSPRCKICAAPFAGLGGLVFRRAGFRQSPGNPALCGRCIAKLRKRQMTGVEIPITLLFSDICGSTGLGERMPSRLPHLPGPVLSTGIDSIVAHDGIVDKVVGDEVIGLFFGGISGPHHPAVAVAAAIDLAERAAQASTTPSVSIPVGTAVHTGEAFVGATGAWHNRRRFHRAR